MGFPPHHRFPPTEPEGAPIPRTGLLLCQVRTKRTSAPCLKVGFSFSELQWNACFSGRAPMPLTDLIGAPQIAAALVLAQRGLEELYSARSTRALLAAGAHQEGSTYYPVVAAAHLAWIA